MLQRTHKMTAIIAYLCSRVSSWVAPKPIVPEPLKRHITIDDISKYKEIIVIGDLHGCHDEMISLFNEAAVDINDDRILKLFVGDLVNKGPQNLEVLDAVMKMPSAMSVRGNHDEVVLREAYRVINDVNYSLKPRNEWMSLMTVAKVAYLRKMPYTISLPKLNAIIVHAGLIPNVHIDRQKPSDMITMRNIISKKLSTCDDNYEAVCGTNAGECWAEIWNGPEHVYFGHDAVRGLQLHKYATGLDTGCVYGHKLSAIFIHGPNKGKIVYVNATKVHKDPMA